MVGQFTILPVGRREQKSKSGKYEYWFANGIKREGQHGALLDKCQCFNFWTEAEYNLEFMKPVQAILDVNGDFVTVVELLEKEKKTT